MRRRRPNRWLPIADELAVAPELAILGTIEAAIDIAIVALVAAQPELRQSTGRFVPVVSAQAEHADDVIAKAQALAAAIAGYRLACLDAARSTAERA